MGRVPKAVHGGDVVLIFDAQLGVMAAEKILATWVSGACVKLHLSRLDSRCVLRGMEESPGSIGQSAR